MKPSGIEPATFRFLVLCLNHYATLSPSCVFLRALILKTAGNIEVFGNVSCSELLDYVKVLLVVQIT
jgi:hypothetical protein